VSADAPTSARLRFTWAEFSGSLGDLGLFLPLVVAMATVGNLDLGVILVAAGAMNVATGLLFRQPIPVQPMKAIAAVAITEGLMPGALMASGLIMGALLLILALSGGVDAIGRLVPSALVRGIQLGVGLKLAAKGAGWVGGLPFLGWDGILVAAVGSLLLLYFLYKRWPGLLFVFFFGFVLLFLEDPAAYHHLTLTLPKVSPVWPSPAEWEAGLLRGALPQLPLTLLNSVIAVCALSADYYPGRGIAPRRMAASVGIMNLLCVPFGAIPMCHGAGGLAAQHRFGARTGGSVVMLGAAKIAVGASLGVALVGILNVYPLAILGPMLVFAGVELARSGTRNLASEEHRVVALLTAGTVLGANTFAGFLVGTLFLLCLRLRRRLAEAGPSRA